MRIVKLGTVTHAYNPSYLRGSDQEDQDSRIAQAQFTTPPSPPTARCQGAHLSSQTMREAERITVPEFQVKRNPILKEKAGHGGTHLASQL
jgi:hypothetical protein